ncbi:hypothetical protein BJX61DRAFT_449278 [Aspergillus egyptiacus]|nr:hypothetical protein BJX61DRAFT_449278 [Aspergillus egyptiacus]
MSGSQYHELGSIVQPVNQRAEQSSRRYLALASSHLALIGFLVMPLAFDNAEKSPHVNRTAIVISASILIGVAHLFSLSLALLYHRERRLLIHSVLIPHLISGSLAVLNVLLNIFCRGPIPLDLLEILTLSFSVAFAFLYAVWALWLFALDVNEATVGASNCGTILLTDEEMQRQQLQRLLEQNSSRKSLSPRAVQKTYQVNHPERLNSFLPPPHDDGYFT